MENSIKVRVVLRSIESSPSFTSFFMHLLIFLCSWRGWSKDQLGPCVWYSVSGSLIQFFLVGTFSFIVKCSFINEQMGYAHGQLLKDQINKLIPEVEAFIDETIYQYLDFLPEVSECSEFFGRASSLHPPLSLLSCPESNVISSLTQFHPSLLGVFSLLTSCLWTSS